MAGKRHRWAWMKTGERLWTGTCVRCDTTTEVEEVGPARLLRRRYYLPNSIERLVTLPPCPGRSEEKKP